MNTHNNAVLELERTFLARYIPPEVATATAIDMEDVYIPEDMSVHPSLRVRRLNNKYEITKKVQPDQGDASRHLEMTIDLSETEYAALRKASSRTVAKKRYQVTIDTFSAEVDVFTGNLAGLVLIDFEFSTPEAMEQFSPPDCCLLDVTQEVFIAGGMLAGRSYHDIEPALTRLGYSNLGDTI